VKKIFKKEHQKGQVAIFIALIFQVLFVFFAMLINVGLLVHHKINLQNSVDLAAYYGAMKQAEVMNAIAHVNFQIRQSMKLMTFRYRHLGQFGYTKYPGNANPLDTDEDSGVFPQFCSLYLPFDYMKSNENYCRESGEKKPYTIRLPPLPNSGGHSLFGFNDAFVGAVDSARTAIRDDCRKKRALSIFTLLLFNRAYKLDVAQRKQLAVNLARRISEPADKMKDIDNESIKEGIEKTLEKNLTYQNKESKPEITIENSFSSEKCGNPEDPDAPPKWLVEKFFWPIYWSFLANCSADGSEATSYEGAPISLLDDLKAGPLAPIINQTLADPTFGNAIQDLYELMGEPDGTVPKTNYYKSTTGFEKNPWCMSYIAVKVKTKPKIPFSLPFGQVELEAKAYAKPFGATIGPWAKSKWDASSDYSNTGEDVDTVTPIRMRPGQTMDNTMANDPKFILDFPRYVGDVVGTKSNLTMNSYYTSFNNSRKINLMSLTFWNHLFDPRDDLFTPGTNGDFLTWSPNGASDENAMKLRDLEIAAILPDQFDVAYYSVEPDYYRNYYLRLNQPKQEFKFPIRGDLGMQHKQGVAQAP